MDSWGWSLPINKGLFDPDKKLSEYTDMQYIFDEPSVSLHARDIHRMSELLQKLRDAGNAVIVIEHNLHIIKNADWIIDMDPEGGSKGGTVMFEGTSRALLKAKRSVTSQYLYESIR